MPFLLRIIFQRALVFFLGFLAFLGVNPDIDPPTNEEIDIIEENQREIVSDILTPSLEESKTTEKLNQIEKNVEDIVKSVTDVQLKTQETVEKIVNVPKIETTDSGIALKKNLIEDVVVNIVCVNKNSNIISLSTGSGVLVSSSGLVLTNSHVANAFLFNDKTSKNYKNCTVRRENIPTYGFEAELVYLPDDWLRENKSFFNSDAPRGSGENDYSLIAITKNTNPALSVPTFEYIPVLKDESPIDKNLNITVAAYPGVNTGIFEVDSNAELKVVSSSVKDLITFGSNTVDLVSTEPNSVAKRGSSGGGLFWSEKLLGIITTTNSDSSGHYINAITSPYIIRDFNKDTGKDFESFIFSNKNSLISDFKNNKEGYLKSLIADFL